MENYQICYDHTHQDGIPIDAPRQKYVYPNGLSGNSLDEQQSTDNIMSYNVEKKRYGNGNA